MAEGSLDGEFDHFEQARPVLVDGRALAPFHQLPDLRAGAVFALNDGERLGEIQLGDVGLVPTFVLGFVPGRLLIGASLDDGSGIELQLVDIEGRPRSGVLRVPLAGGMVPTSRQLLVVPTEASAVFSFFGDAGREFFLLSRELTSATRLEAVGETPPSMLSCWRAVASPEGNAGSLICASGVDTGDGSVELQVHRGAIDVATNEVRFERLRTSTPFEYPTSTTPVLVDNGTDQLLVMTGRFRGDRPSSCFVLLLDVGEDQTLTEVRRLFPTPCVYDPEVWFSDEGNLRIAGRWSVDPWDGPVLGRMETLSMPELESVSAWTYPLRPSGAGNRASGYDLDGVPYLFSNSYGPPEWPLELVRCDL